MEPRPEEPSQTNAGYPVTSLLDVLTPEVVERHLATMSDAEVAETYTLLVPEGTATKEGILALVRNSFFKQAASDLSGLVGGHAVGQLLARSLGYEYKGEGLEAFLAGIRETRDKEN